MLTLDTRLPAAVGTSPIHDWGWLGGRTEAARPHKISFMWVGHNRTLSVQASRVKKYCGIGAAQIID